MDVGFWQRYFTTEIYNTWNEFITLHLDWYVVHTREQWDQMFEDKNRLKEVKRIVFVEHHVIFSDWHPTLRSVSPNTQIFFWCDDLHHEWCPRAHKLEGVTYMSTYGYMSNYLGDGAHTTYHAAQSFFLQPYTNDPIPKLLLTGSVTSGVYPMRHFVLAQSKKAAAGQIDTLKHCQEANPDVKLVGARYAAKISEYLAGWCSTVKEDLPYLVAKYIEIPATGSLLMADRFMESYLLDAGFVDGENCILCNESDFNERLVWVLSPDHRTEVDRIRSAGRALVLDRHLTSHRVRQIETIIGL